MYLKYVNTVYFVFKYKIHFEFASNTKYKIHRMYFKYVFEIIIFEILYNSEHASKLLRAIPQVNEEWRFSTTWGSLTS